MRRSFVPICFLSAEVLLLLCCFFCDFCQLARQLAGGAAANAGPALLGRLLSEHMPGIDSLVKYAGIVLCFLHASVLRPQSMQAQALFVTLAADFFLLFTPLILPGLFFFCLVQLIYANGLSNPLRRVPLPTRKQSGGLCAATALLSLLELSGVPLPASLLSVTLAMLYAGLLLRNLVYAGRRMRRRKATDASLLFYGILLLLLGDMHVLLANPAHILAAGLPMPPLHEDIPLRASCAIWTLYLPSQILIACSCAPPMRSTHPRLPEASAFSRGSPPATIRALRQSDSPPMPH